MLHCALVVARDRRNTFRSNGQRAGSLRPRHATQRNLARFAAEITGRYRAGQLVAVRRFARAAIFGLVAPMIFAERSVAKLAIVGFHADAITSRNRGAAARLATGAQRGGVN